MPYKDGKGGLKIKIFQRCQVWYQYVFFLPLEFVCDVISFKKNEKRNGGGEGSTTQNFEKFLIISFFISSPKNICFDVAIQTLQKYF